MSSQRQTLPSPTQEAHYLKLLGAHIRKLRQDSGIGLDDLAARVGLHRTHLWKIEMGTVNAGVTTYVRLAIAFNLTIGDLFPEIPNYSEELTEDN